MKLFWLSINHPCTSFTYLFNVGADIRAFYPRVRFLGCMNVYLTIGTDGYLCINSLWAVIAVWLHSERSQDNV